MRMSIHIIDAPQTQAASTVRSIHLAVEGLHGPIPLKQVITHPLSSFDSPMLDYR